jgi:hypothetical protein
MMAANWCGKKGALQGLFMLLKKLKDILSIVISTGSDKHTIFCGLINQPVLF